MDPLKAKANYSRVCHLLVDKGGDVLRNALHAVHPPSTLASVLNANKKTLQRIRYSVIKASQWDLLFPRSGSPDSNNFDITLLTVLLRNICGLSAPATGWNVMPPVSDTSISANILRVKMFRNEVYGHIPTAGLDDVTFETLWQEISVPLAKLGIPQNDIDELKVAPLSPEEESYIERLKEWKQQEDDFMSKLSDVESKVVKLTKKFENVQHSHLEQLAKFNFAGKIRDLSRKFHDGTRKWLFDKLSSWFGSEESRVLILTAGPGVGKSLLSAKLCELFGERGQLAAHHFCDFRNSDSSNPQRILQSLASQMCDNVEGFRDKLTEILRREHSRDSLSDAFRVLLNDPLHALHRHDSMLIIVDALDESKTDDKSEFLELISERFCELPDWIKIFISSRPELQVRKILEHLHPWEIRPDDEDHDHDIELFVRHSLPNLDDNSISRKNTANQLTEATGTLMKKGNFSQFSGTSLKDESKPSLVEKNFSLSDEVTTVKHREKIMLLKAKDCNELRETKIPLKSFSKDKALRIGKGSPGTHVYVGLMKDGREVAVKRILKETCDLLAQNELEIFRLLTKDIRSPYIVNYWYFDCDDFFMYLVMDLCEENLKDYVVETCSLGYLRKHGVRMIEEILLGLQVLHDDRGILHRDLKPSNILVSVDGRMRLADFGISRVLNDDETTVLTEPKRTDGWIPPEVIKEMDNEGSKGRYKRKSDVHVAGMIAFFILTKGEHPFGPRLERMSNISKGKPIFLDKVTALTAQQFISELISHNIDHRPYVKDALKHCFFKEQSHSILHDN